MCVRNWVIGLEVNQGSQKSRDVPLSGRPHTRARIKLAEYDGFEVTILVCQILSLQTAIIKELLYRMKIQEN